MSYSVSIPAKTKTYYPLSLSEAKRHLRIEEDYNEDDDYISNLIIAATAKAEQYIGKDIATTSNVVTIYDFNSSYIEITGGFFIAGDPSLSSGTIDYKVEKYNSLNIYLTEGISADPLTITYSTGFAQGECPILISQAILIKIADLYDTDRQSYQFGGLKTNKAFESLLDSFRLIQFS